MTDLTTETLPHINRIMPVARPRCAYCGKPLKLRTYEITLPLAEIVPGEPYGVYFDASRRIIPVAYIRERERFGKPCTTVWTGGYDSYEGMFCKLACAAHFAGAAYRAGYRMKGDA